MTKKIKKKPLKIEITLDYGYDKEVLNRCLENIKTFLDEKSSDFLMGGTFGTCTSEGYFKNIGGNMVYKHTKMNSDSYNFWIKMDDKDK